MYKLQKISTPKTVFRVLVIKINNISHITHPKCTTLQEEDKKIRV